MVIVMFASSVTVGKLVDPDKELQFAEAVLVIVCCGETVISRSQVTVAMAELLAGRGLSN